MELEEKQTYFLVPSKRGGESQQIDSGNGHRVENPTVDNKSYKLQQTTRTPRIGVRRQSSGAPKSKNIFGEESFGREDDAQRMLS